MGKVIKFKKTRQREMLEAVKDAQEEFLLLMKLTDGKPDLAPSWLTGMPLEAYKRWEAGEFEL